MRQEGEGGQSLCEVGCNTANECSWIKLQNLQHVHPAMFKLITTNVKETIAVYP